MQYERLRNILELSICPTMNIYHLFLADGKTRIGIHKHFVLAPHCTTQDITVRSPQQRQCSITATGFWDITYRS